MSRGPAESWDGRLGGLKSVGKAQLHRCYTEVMGSIRAEFGGWIRRVAEGHGYRIVPAASDLEPEFRNILTRCSRDTMLSLEALYTLFSSSKYVVTNGIPGAIVQCGTWRGGSARLILETLRMSLDMNRDVYLYDTFEGMPQPGPEDRHGATNEPATQIIHRHPSSGRWLSVPEQVVWSTVVASGYPTEKFRLIKGLVEETVPGTVPERIALLHLDTDWYSSTRHELVHLFPRLSTGGVIVIDDYGGWKGARKATDEYFASTGEAILLARVDWTCRVGVKA